MLEITGARTQRAKNFGDPTCGHLARWSN